MEICPLHKWFVTLFNFKVNKGGNGSRWWLGCTWWLWLHSGARFCGDWLYCARIIINSNYQQGLSQINLHMAERHKRSQCNYRYTQVPTLSTCWHRACQFLILLWEYIIWFMCERSVREEYKSHFCSAFWSVRACWFLQYTWCITEWQPLRFTVFPLSKN